MKIAEINIATNGSTGTIMSGIAEVAESQGHTVQTYSPIRFLRGQKAAPPDISRHHYWGTRAESFCHYYVGSLFGRNGLLSYQGTRQLIRDLRAFKPDLIHLHVIHTYCIHLPLLFRYIHKHNIPVVWTFHDCWAFTGNCAHFAMANCERWKSGCHHCPQPKTYPKMYIDTSKKMYRLKKRLFTDVKNLVVVTPSKWLEALTKQSFFGKCEVRLIRNGIDRSIFKPTDSDIRERYGLRDKKILLGVASGWNVRKGLDVFLQLAKQLPKEYCIVLIGSGATAAVQGLDNVLCIPRTENQQQLAAWYTAADVLINPTREDTYPTVNMEALACGTPVLTFNTGGSPEAIDLTCGSVVEVDDIDAMQHEIVRICERKPYTAEACLRRAEQFDKRDRFEEYVQLYEEMMDE